MSSPIVVRALEAELARVFIKAADSLRVLGTNGPDGYRGSERLWLYVAQDELTKFTAEYDAVEAELRKAREAVNLSGDVSAIEQAAEGPSGLASPSSWSTASAPLVDHSTGWGPK